MECVEPSVIEAMITTGQDGYQKQIEEIEIEIQGRLLLSIHTDRFST